MSYATTVCQFFHELSNFLLTVSLPTCALPTHAWNVSGAQLRTSVNDVNRYSRTEDFTSVVHMARGVLKAQANSKRAKSKPEAVDDEEPVVPAEARPMEFFC